MKKYILKREQFIPAPVETVWDYFSHPKNLQAITPSDMKFVILTNDLPDQIYSGLRIKYHVSPLFGIKLKWETEITDVKQNEHFADIQRKGPFRLWHHRHTFVKSAHGTLMIDEVEYALPFAFAGKLIHYLMIRDKIKDIFDFRFKRISETFELKTAS